MKTSLMLLSVIGLAFTGCATKQCAAHKAECHAKNAAECHDMKCPMHHGDTAKKSM